MTLPPEKKLHGFFQEQGWKIFDYQKKAWSLFREKKNVLLTLPTGSGKTYAAVGGALVEMAEEGNFSNLQVLYLTPLKAVSRDVASSVETLAQSIDPRIRVALRTGDTNSYQRQKLWTSVPQILITTPESLSLLLTQEAAQDYFSALKICIVDEWHELLGSKRGVLTELALARLQAFSPAMKRWALSASLPNLDHAGQVLVGNHQPFEIVQDTKARSINIDIVLPHSPEDLPWTGHMGLRLLPSLLDHLNPKHSSLIFTNTRFQSESWYQEILKLKPEWGSLIALHHGSIDTEERHQIEDRLKNGSLRFVVCTSTLDLGVDLQPVDRVYQIGSVKSVARLVQRAGRASHRPGATPSLFFVPTQALHLAEIFAVKQALAENQIEKRMAFGKSLDLLHQHLVTVAMGGGFEEHALFEEVRSTWSFQSLTKEEFEWVLNMAETGGSTLYAYPEFRKIQKNERRYEMKEKRIAQLHRMNIGTIMSDSRIQVHFLRGKSLGFIEESFIAKLKKGDHFIFAGQCLEFLMIRDLTVYVRKSRARNGVAPRWNGGNLPISDSLSRYLRRSLQRLRDDHSSQEARSLQRFLERQQRVSSIPSEDELLIELTSSREGGHLFVFSFEGTLVNEALAILLAHRFSMKKQTSFHLTANDYGFEIVGPRGFDFETALRDKIWAVDNLEQDILSAINSAEVTKRQFREIARVAGLVYQNTPGKRKRGSHIQASSALIFDVLHDHDPENLFLKQALEESLRVQFEWGRLKESLLNLQKCHHAIRYTKEFSPLAMVLHAERLAASLSSESLAERIKNMQRLAS